MKIDRMKDELLKGCGGQLNIMSLENCMTRLRIEIKQNDLFSATDLREIDGVIDVIEEGHYKQIVIGSTEAKRLCDLINKQLYANGNINNWQQNKDVYVISEKKTFSITVLKTISDIFIPMIPGIIAAGLLNGFSGLISNFQLMGVLPTDGGVEFIKQLFSLIGNTFLSYFPIFTGYYAAQRFGVTPILGGMLGAVNIMPSIINLTLIIGLFHENATLQSILTSGNGGVIGVIVGVYLLSIIEKNIRKHVPAMLDVIIIPVSTLLIGTLAYVLLIMPISGVLIELLSSVLLFLIEASNPIIDVMLGFLMAACFLPLVLMGVHHGLSPIYMTQLEQLGGVSLFPVLAMAGAGQVGAACAIYLKAKFMRNYRLQNLITASLPSGLLGIGEPLIYGLTLPLGKPFITAGIGAGFGGAYIMATDVLATAWGPSGLVAIPLMQPDSTIHYVIGLFISYLGGFIVTELLVKNTDIPRT